MSILTFWAGDHPLTEAGNVLSDKLVSEDGHCDTLQGELLRAATKIHWDWFNNGWGCNNWSGPVVFLERHFKDLPVQPDISEHVAFLGALSYVREFSHGEPSPKNEDRADEVVTRLLETVVQSILDNPVPVPNKLDMYDLEERDYNDRDFGDDHDERYY